MFKRFEKKKNNKKTNSFRFSLIRFYGSQEGAWWAGSIYRPPWQHNFIGYFRTWLKSTSITDSTFRKPLNVIFPRSLLLLQQL
jgi:hypothetical protein